MTQTCGISELRISQRSLGIFPNQNLENTSQNKTSIMSVTWLWHLTLHTFFIQLLLEVASNQSSDGKLGQVQTRPNKTRPEEPIHPSSSTECSTGLLVERELTPGDSAEKGVHPGETYGGKQPFRPTFTPMDHKKTPLTTRYTVGTKKKCMHIVRCCKNTSHHHLHNEWAVVCELSATFTATSLSIWRCLRRPAKFCWQPTLLLIIQLL